MAAQFSLGVRITGLGSGAACAELRSTSSLRPRIKQIEITLAAATASTFGLGRPAAIGVTPTSPVAVLGNDTIDTGVSVVALAWGTGPTVPANFMRRISLPATIGSGIIWTFSGDGLIVPLSNSIVLWNLSAVGAADVNFLLEE